jgi:hypothetical protein
VGTCFSTTINMLTQLDYELFPNNPEVYRLPSGELVARIFKNATSSLDRQGYELATLDEIEQANTITAYWREPVARFCSGVSTFVQQTGIRVEDAVQYLFLNRHYAPQFYSLINLRRFMNRHACFSFKELGDIGSITEFHEVPYSKTEVPITDKVHFYLTCDKVVWEKFLDTTVHINEVLRVLKLFHIGYYKEVFEHSKTINASI